MPIVISFGRIGKKIVPSAFCKNFNWLSVDQANLQLTTLDAHYTTCCWLEFSPCNNTAARRCLNTHCQINRQKQSPAILHSKHFLVHSLAGWIRLKSMGIEFNLNFESDQAIWKEALFQSVVLIRLRRAYIKNETISIGKNSKQTNTNTFPLFESDAPTLEVNMPNHEL